MCPVAFWKNFCLLCFCGEICIHPATETQGTAQTLLAVFPPASNHRTALFNNFPVVLLAAGNNAAGLEALEILVLKVRSAPGSSACSPAKGSSQSCPAALPRTAGSCQGALVCLSPVYPQAEGCCLATERLVMLCFVLDPRFSALELQLLPFF